MREKINSGSPFFDKEGDINDLVNSYSYTEYFDSQIWCLSKAYELCWKTRCLEICPWARSWNHCVHTQWA